MQTPVPTPTPQEIHAQRLARLARLEEYLKLDPANPVLRREAGELCLSLARADEALFHINAGLCSAPGDAQLVNAKAIALMASGRHSDAVPSLADLLQSRADSHIAFNLAYAQLQSGDAPGARETLTPFVESGQCDSMIAALWIRSLHHLGELETAIAFARAQEARCACDAGFLGAAALAYFDAEAFPEAERTSRAALALDSRSSDALIVRGSLALGRAEAMRALADFDRAEQRAPNDGRVAAGLGMARLVAGDAMGARESLRRAVVLMPSHIGTWHALGWACIALRAWSEAATVMQKALELDRNFGESHGAVAVVAALSGRRDDAQAAIDRAMRLDPRGLSARYAQLVLSGEAADPTQFERAANRVLSSRSLPGGLTVADILARRH